MIQRTSDGIAYVRTPDTNFEDLPGYAFAPHYLDWQGLRLHYVDEGPRQGPVALLMHGMPSWSFLNRHIVAHLARAGYRCIAADHIGFGRSDKAVDEGWYTIARHTAAHRALVEALDLRGVSLFCQDWGGPIGLAQAAEMPERFDRLVIMNTLLDHEGGEYTDDLRLWNAAWKPGGFFRRNVPDRFTIGTFMMAPLGFMPQSALTALAQHGTEPELSAEQQAIRRAYDAPFAGLGEPGLSGPRRFPLCLPFDDPESGNAAAQARHFRALLDWRKPIHFIWGGSDPVFPERLGRAWAASYPHATFDLLGDAGHFLQETHGNRIAELFLARVASS